MLPHKRWIDWFLKHPSNKDCNRNMAGFSSILGSEVPNAEKLSLLIEEIDKVI
jgi:hypothetical protein